MLATSIDTLRRIVRGGRLVRAWPPLPLALLALLALAPHAARAEGYDVLAECMALTGDDDEVHACLDNYLDVMDDNIDDLEAFLRRELDGGALAGFERSQSAFASYRRENCLWYLGFNSPRSNAEKLAKNCLARMSLDRLAELQSLLVRDDDASRAVDGFYVYGANRNSFRPCGTDARYWIEGDAGAVGALQQGYAALATADLQVMFASVDGSIEENSDAPVDHDGVLRVRSVRDVRVPSDGDCRLPDGSPPVTSVAAVETGGPDRDGSRDVAERVADVPARAAGGEPSDTGDDRDAIARAEPSGASEDAPSAEDWIEYSAGAAAPAGPVVDLTVDPPADLAADPAANPVADPDAVRPPPPAPAPAPAPAAPAAVAALAPPAPDLPEVAPGERLTAYFGAWLADCEAATDGRSCRVAVDLGDGGDPPTLALLRRDAGTTVELSLPERRIGAASDVDWAVDGYAFGGAGTGAVTVGAEGTVVRVADPRFVAEELVPLMKRGSTLVLDVDSDGSSERLEGTLVGLTRALGFADGFLSDGGP